MKNFITNSDAENLKKRLTELINKSEELKWLDLSNLPENVVPSQRAALEHVVKGISYSEYGW